MKYMIMMFGSAETMMETQSTDWITEMISFMTDLDKELTEAGEMVFNAGLADGSQGKAVTYGDSGVVVTDGPFAESKESIIGYWVVDVVDEARALAIATKVVDFTHGPIEVRQVMDGPPDV